MDISVILPTSKPGDYIWPCLDSLKKQTLQKERFEVIVILNGCNEPYKSSIDDYIQNSSEGLRIRLIQTDEGGVSNARNIGLEQAEGQYITFLDDDDWVSESYLENLLQPATSENIVVANVRNYNEATQSFDDDYLARAYKKNQNREKITLLSGRSFFSCCPCKLIPRSIIGSHRFNTMLSQSEDAVFMAALSKNVKGITLVTPDTIYYRRTREGSARHNRSRIKAAADVVKIGWVFVKLYCSDMCHYSLPFFLTRIAGLTKNIFRD